MKKIIKHLGGYRVTRRALRHYSYYRDCSWLDDKKTLMDLVHFHVYESTGELPDSIRSYTDFTSSNGFAHGKWQARLVQDMILEDLSKGNVCKAEFMNSHHHREVFDELPNYFAYKKGNWFVYNYIKNVSVK